MVIAGVGGEYCLGMLLVRYISVPNGRPGPVPLRALWDKIDDKAAATIHLGRVVPEGMPLGN